MRLPRESRSQHGYWVGAMPGNHLICARAPTRVGRSRQSIGALGKTAHLEKAPTGTRNTLPILGAPGSSCLLLPRTLTRKSVTINRVAILNNNPDIRNVPSNTRRKSRLDLAHSAIQQLFVRSCGNLKSGLAARKSIKLGRARPKAVPPCSSARPRRIEKTQGRWTSARDAGSALCSLQIDYKTVVANPQTQARIATAACELITSRNALGNRRSWRQGISGQNEFQLRTHPRFTKKCARGYGFPQGVYGGLFWNAYAPATGTSDLRSLPPGQSRVLPGESALRLWSVWGSEAVRP